MVSRKTTQTTGSSIGADSRTGWVRVLSREVDATPTQSKRVSTKMIGVQSKRRGYKRLLNIARETLNREMVKWRRRAGFVGATLMEEVDKEGRVTGRPCIRIFVRQTTSETELSANQKFPDSLDGVKIQVSAAMFGATVGTCDEDARAVTSTLDGGDIIRPAHAENERGTVGLVVQESTSKAARYLTAAHVVLGGEQLSTISNESVWSKLDDAGKRVVGSFDRSTVNFSGSVDCALIVPQPDYPKTHPTIIRCFDGYPGGIRTSSQSVELHEPVRMFSRKLQQISRGTVSGLDLSVNLEDLAFLTNLVLVHPLDGQKHFGVQGDSGSVVLDAAGRVLGLFIGVMVDDNGVPREDGSSIVCRISEVRKVLKFRLF